MPRQLTRSDLMEMRKHTNKPHMSYDVDGDGIVSAEDMRVAKRFDSRRLGTLDRDQNEFLKHSLVRDFMQDNKKDLWLYGSHMRADPLHTPEDTIVRDMAESRHFLAEFGNLQKAERRYRVGGSAQMKETLKDPDLPRSRSRQTLLAQRLAEARALGTMKLEQRFYAQPEVFTKRINLITDNARMNGLHHL